MDDNKQKNQEKSMAMKGNSRASKGPEYKSLRSSTKDEVMRAAASLIKPIRTLQQDLANKDATRLEFITANAIKNNNTKYIQWLLEMAIGKPKQTVEASGNDGGSIQITYTKAE